MLIVAIALQDSPIHGVGVYAAKPIAAGTVVWQFDPGIDHLHPISWLREQPPHVQRFVVNYGVLNLEQTHYYTLGDQTLFVNHSLSPNLVPRDDILVNGEGVVVAARDIAAGEELTVNYGTIDGCDRDRLAQGLPLF